MRPVKYLTGVILLMLVLILAAGCTIKAGGDVPKSAIYSTLVGHNMTYYSIAGKPLNYTITQGDIGSIDQTSYQGDPAWKVHVGTSLAWDLTLSADGTKILNSKQLFQS